jgi:putative restriction endonuclease
MTPLDPDLELRLAAFDHVAKLQQSFGRLLRAEALDQPFLFAGEWIRLWLPRKGIWKPRQLGEGGAALSIFTAYGGSYDDRHDPESASFVYHYQRADPFNADNRALRRAFELQRPLIYIIGLERGLYEVVFPCYVHKDHLESMTVEVLTDAPGREIVLPEGQSPFENLILKQYVTREVKKRVHQDRLRASVMRAYGERCSMCRLNQAPLLDAAHIIPDNEPGGDPVLPNALSLCKIHHGAYGAHILGIDPDYRIHVNERVLKEEDGPMLLHGLQALDGQGLKVVPRRREERPDPERLGVWFERFRAA